MHKKEFTKDSTVTEMLDYGKRVLRKLGFFRKSGPRSIIEQFKYWGLYCTNCKDFMDTKLMADAQQQAVLKSYLLSLPKIPNPETAIPESVWVSAIELSMWIYHPNEILRNAGDWTRYAHDLISIVWVLVWVQMASDFTETYKSTGDVLKLKKELEDAKKRLEALDVEKRRRVQANEVAEKLKQDLSKLRKSVDVEVYNATKPLLVLLEKRDAELEELRKALCEKESTNTSLPVDVNTRGDVRVPIHAVVLGGHGSLQKKLLEDNEGWKFIEAGERNCAVLPDTDCVIVHAGYLDHSTYYKFLSQAKSIPVVYITGSNLPLIYQSISEQCEDYIAKGSKIPRRSISGTN